MTLFLLPILLLAADTGRAGPLAPAPSLAIAIQSDDNRESLPAQDGWLSEDKFKHLAFSYMITARTFGAARLVTDHDASVGIAALSGLVAGVGKEIYDRKRSGPSARDFLWDAIGISAAVLIARETR
jgi:uncharacterized protein YfiM (DUF2279 family)